VDCQHVRPPPWCEIRRGSRGSRRFRCQGRDAQGSGGHPLGTGGSHHCSSCPSL